MTRRNTYMLTGIVLLIVVVLYWFFALSPLRGEISETETQIASEQQALDAARAKLVQMEQTRVEAKRNNARLIELAKMVPVENEVPSLILQIQDLAAESGIEFMSISPSPPDGTVADVGQVALLLSFKGDFFDVNDFLYRAEQMASGPGRLLAGTSVNLTASGEPRVGSSPELQVEIALDAYRRAAPVGLPPVLMTPPQPIQANNEQPTPDAPADLESEQASAAQAN